MPDAVALGKRYIVAAVAHSYSLGGGMARYRRCGRSGPGGTIPQGRSRIEVAREDGWAHPVTSAPLRGHNKSRCCPPPAA